MFEKDEVMAFVVGAVVIGFLVGFDDGRPFFVWQFWLVHVVLVILLALVLLLVYATAQRLAAERLGGVVKKELWSLRRFGFKFHQHSRFGLPLWLIVPAIVFLLSSTKIVFAGVLGSVVSTIARLRVGSKTPGIDDVQRASILLAGPLSMMVLTIILMGFEPSPLVLAARYLCVSLAVCNLLPLPNLDGFSIFLSSLPLYMFSSILIVLVLFMVLQTSVIIALIVAFLIATEIVGLYWWKTI